ncbi:cobyrinate a,c-diamide synthase [Petroclostridium sp. X23]|nr:cobyrinate a,c-diamide synthase [Petroclostridium sp. X23]WHH61771.1 cobyrinate a,c-diamide synthase [Petroclostridium sp. X23]
MPRFIIAGAHSGTGKTTISLGLMAALKKRGLSVAPYKVGPDYIDPAYHTYVTGNKSRNLDSWMLEDNTIKYLFNDHSQKADISVIEGVMGLYDGFGTTKDSGSTAHVSKILKAPVILVINGRGISSSAAAMVLGYKLYDPEVRIAGIIINRVSGQKHFQLLKEIIERDTGTPVLGYIPNDTDISLSSRHLGLVPSVEMGDLQRKMDKIRQLVEQYVDMEKLMEIAYAADELEECRHLFSDMQTFDGVRIGVAKDKAFNFYYEDNLDLLEKLGAQLIYFSPMEHRELPEELDGLYLGGGFPEVFAQELEQNQLMRWSIRQALQKGLPTYAECGGLMYLTESIQDFEGKTYDMVGIFHGHSKMTARLQRFGYVNVELGINCLIGEKGTTFRAHEFHRSVVEIQDDGCCYKVTKQRDGVILDTWKCGYTLHNIVAGYAHVHFWSNPVIVQHFLNKCVKLPQKKT